MSNQLILLFKISNKKYLFSVASFNDCDDDIPNNIDDDDVTYVREEQLNVVTNEEDELLDVSELSEDDVIEEGDVVEIDNESNEDLDDVVSEDDEPSNTPFIAPSGT